MEKQIKKLIERREALKSELCKLIDKKSPDFQRISEMESEFSSVTEELFSLYAKLPEEHDTSRLSDDTSAIKKKVSEYLLAAHKTSTPLWVTDATTGCATMQSTTSSGEITFHPRLNVTKIVQAEDQNKPLDEEKIWMNA
jgi:predicted nuclease with TOPRIM domain